MRVTVVDPPAYTPPYDHALCAALARRGADVELATSCFRYAPPPDPAGYRRNVCFYRRDGHATRRRAAKALLSGMDAVVVHSEAGRTRLIDELALEPAKVRVVPHGAFDHLTRLGDELPPDPAVGELEDRRVVLFFGLLRPYKGV